MNSRMRSGAIWWWLALLSLAPLTRAAAQDEEAKRKAGLDFYGFVMVDAIFDAMSHIVPGNVRADGSGSRSIILGGRSTYTGKGYVQYEIIAGGAGARASKDGASGITVNQSNAKIAPIEIIESEFPTRIARFELIADSGGAGEFRGGPGLQQHGVETIFPEFGDCRVVRIPAGENYFYGRIDGSEFDRSLLATHTAGDRQVEDHCGEAAA